MIRLSFLIRILSACLLVLCALPASAETWHRADTRNFIIYSDGDRRSLENFATRAEMFDALFREYFSLDAVAPANRLTIFMLAGADDVAELAHDENGTTAGFYRATGDGSFAVSNRARARRETSLSGQTVLFHEYVHHLMARYFTFGYPAWYREGFAEYFATATFENDGDWTLGEPANHRAIGIRRVNLALEDVLFGDLDALSSRGRDAYYGRAWLLVHMLANDRQRNNQLTDYLTRVGSGEDPREAFAVTFGDLDALESELESYGRGRLTSLVSTSPIAIRGTVEVRTLDDVQSALVDLSMHRRVGREQEDVRNSLRQLAAQNPDNADVLAELALAEYELAEAEDEPDFAATQSAVAATLALDPTHGRINLLKAELTMEQLTADGAGKAGEADWDAVRALIATAQQANPESPLPLVADYLSYTRQRRQPPVEAVNGLGSALQLAPEDYNIRAQLAYALANEGLYNDAIQLVEFLSSDPHSGGFGKRLIADLRRRRDQQYGSQTES